MRLIRTACFVAVLAPGLLLGAASPLAQNAPVPARSIAEYQEKLERYLLARKIYEDEAGAYWTSIAEKRRARNAKRRNNEKIVADDYVLTQPPLYAGPPPPVDPQGKPVPVEPRAPIPVIADFLGAAAEHHRFVPDRPENELAFKRAYARTATAAGLTREQAVRIYAFETGGNGTYDVQAGLTHPRPNARAISPAMGYNQLLTTNSIGLLAEHGDKFVATLHRRLEGMNGDPKTAMQRKIEALRRMVAFVRTVPNAWSEHDKLAKTPGGIGIHAAVLDRDIGPLLQTQKLLDSVLFARSKGHMTPLTAAELEMMNFTGDGNGFDLVTMPAALREVVPTSNFFQRAGYERNPIARKTGLVARLYESIESRMDHGSRLPGARDLAASF